MIFSKLPCTNISLFYRESLFLPFFIKLLSSRGFGVLSTMAVSMDLDGLFLQRCLNMLDGLMTGDLRLYLMGDPDVKDLSSGLRRMMGLVGGARSDVRNLIYEAEDVIDELSYEVSELQVFDQRGSNFKDWYDVAQRFVTGFKLISFRFMFKTELRSLVHRIQILNSELLTRQSSAKFLSPLPRKSQLGDADIITMYPGSEISWNYEEDSIFGIEDAIEAISSSILSEQGSQVVGIWGIPGVGKTTLARKVFQHNCRSFDCVAWAFVGSRFQTRHVYEDILMSLSYSSRDEMAAYSDLDLAEQVFYKLQGRRYLIVLDDICTTDALDCLNIAFPLSSRSRIILTTRSAKVARDKASYVHHMTGLNQDQSLALLFATAFRTQSQDYKDIPAESTNIARKIVSKCSGLPLAVNLMGGLLASSPWGWDKIEHELDSYQANSDSQVDEVLNLSYDSLPSDLKPCFLYLGFFPEGVEIETENLCLLWLAEGFCSPYGKDAYGKASTLDIAERYLNELSVRSLIQFNKQDVPTGLSPKSCRVHDLLHNLCLSKQVEADFSVDMYFRPLHDIRTSPSSLRVPAPNLRRLSLSFDLRRHELQNWDKIVQSVRSRQQSSLVSADLSDLSRLRVLHVCNIQRLTLSRINTELIPWRSLGLTELSEILPVLSTLKSLRVLYCKGFNFDMMSLPAGIGKLHHLRYLSLRNCHIKSFPSTICNLAHLETLDMRECTGTDKLILPNELQKLRSLEHLYLPWNFEVNGGGKLRMHALVKLEILVNFNSALCELKDLSKLKRLRKLVASVGGFLEDLAELSNCIKTNLNSLLFSSLQVTRSTYSSAESRFIDKDILEYLNLNVLHMQGNFGKLPLNMISQALSELSLSGSELEEDPLKILEKLANLSVLSLQDNAFVGKLMTCSVSGMPRLRRLALLHLDNLERLVIQKGSMQNLFSLKIDGCRSLKDPPEELSFLMNLQEFKVLHMPQEFMDRVSLVRKII